MNEEVTAEAEVISGGTQPQPPGSCSSCDQNQQGTVPPHVCNSHVCIKLCSLILTQLVKAHTEVIRRFGGNVGSAMSLSEAADNASPASNSDQTVRPEPDSPTGTNVKSFSIMETAPNSHKFKLTMFQPTDPRNFYRTVRNEIKLLRSSLPTGIWVKGFEDRMDLYSVMIRGPEKTPYEDGLFFFDFQLPPDYPKSPPNCHYVSYCSDRLNPNLYEDGYEKQKGSQQGRENSRMYNEMVVLKLVQAMAKLVAYPQAIFKDEITAHFGQHANKLCERLESWLDVSENYNTTHPLSPTTPTSFKQIHSEVAAVALPEFPLIPASKGFCITLRKTLVHFRNVLGQHVNQRCS
ncbi:hypothetical protein AAG570_004442 [Ranatra chinensis]|uniref:UBC core domain-containing protein n=1 Tax=Ranatra chinensis TaxID=642074 RepID=A0ABD0Y0V6_9HEMI